VAGNIPHPACNSSGLDSGAAHTPAMSCSAHLSPQMPLTGGQELQAIQQSYPHPHLPHVNFVFPSVAPQYYAGPLQPATAMSQHSPVHTTCPQYYAGPLQPATATSQHSPVHTTCPNCGARVPQTTRDATQPPLHPVNRQCQVNFYFSLKNEHS
jgi:hypothetical protein